MPYLVMEFLDGQTLSDFQKANPGLPPPLIADLLDQIGLALAEAHRHGIIHRDLKPDNIGRRLPVAGDLCGREAIGEGGRSALARSDDRLAVRRTGPGDSPSRPGCIRDCGGGRVHRFRAAKWADQARKNVVITATWFPVFALFAGAPLFLYDRTAANETGPLLQLDRTPEVRVTARTFSVSSMVWLAAGAIYLLYQPIKLWLFGGR